MPGYLAKLTQAKRKGQIPYEEPNQTTPCAHFLFVFVRIARRRHALQRAILNISLSLHIELNLSLRDGKPPVHRPRPSRLVVHVGSRVDTVLGELGDLGSEALLDGLEDSLVVGAADE